MRSCLAQPDEKHAQVCSWVCRFMGEVLTEEIVHLLTVLRELGVYRLVVFEDVALVQECEELAKVELPHLLCDERSFQGRFGNKLPDLEIGMV